MNDTPFAKETTMLMEAFAKARQHFYDGTGTGLLAPYGHIAVQNSIPIGWAPFHEMLKDQATHLANDINAFGHHIGQLEAWAQVLPEYGIDDQLGLLMEFVSATAITAVGAPYALRSRLIYSISHLSHQANRNTRCDWPESKLPADADINYKTMVAMADNWTVFPALLTQINALFSESYNDGTGDFRHKYNHRFPPHFQFGISQTVSRTRVKHSGQTTYGFGFVEPLQLDKLTPVLRQQHTVALSAFEQYSELAREQLRAIYATSHDPLS
jgi:hypothetical protein